MYDANECLASEFDFDTDSYDVNALEVFVDEEGDLSHLLTDEDLIALEIQVVGEALGELERDALNAERDGDVTAYRALCEVYDRELERLDDLKRELAEVQRIGSLTTCTPPADFDDAA